MSYLEPRPIHPEGSQDSWSRSEYGEQVGPYRLEKFLGAGGMGEVYRAFDERLQRSVALKKICTEVNRRTRRRFQREAEAIARLNHPNIVNIHDVLFFEDSKNTEWIVMEWVDGDPLPRLIGHRGLPLRRALEIGIDILRALEAAHREGLVHRDLKASNILIDRQGRAKVLDFGLAKQILRTAAAATSLTLDGQIVGTPYAMSPEQAMGRKVDFRSDLFSFGSLLYEMICGVAPFRAPSPVDSLTRVCSHSPPSLAEVSRVPNRISRLVDRLLEKDPLHRPRGTTEVLRELLEISHHPLEGLEIGDMQDQTAPLLAHTATESLPRNPDSTPMSERRQVTVLCCHRVPRGHDSAALDPSLLIDLAPDAFEDQVRAVVEDYGGRVAQIADLLAVAHFGYPRAHEDDAERGVRAGLELVKALGETAPGPVSSEVRVTVHTGPAAVLGQASGMLELALGSTLDVALHLVRTQEGQGVQITRATRRLLHSDFPLEGPAPQGTSAMKAETVTFRVLGNPSSQSRWDLAEGQPLVAREEELGLLLDLWRRARDGRGQVVLVQGEPGIGKSRLVQAFLQRLRDEVRNSCWVAQGSPYAVGTPLFPLLELVRDRVRRMSQGETEEPVADLHRFLATLGLDDPETRALFEAMLGFPIGNPQLLEIFTPRVQRLKKLEALGTLVVEQARRQPLLLLVEDLHWLDPTTLECLTLLIRRLASVPLLLVTTARPEFEAALDETRVVHMPLDRLPGTAVTFLTEQVTDGKSLPAAVQEEILLRTDGVPLFVEELTRAILESGQLVENQGRYELRGDLERLTVPSTLQESIGARLDRLGSAKILAQIASVIGREFNAALLSVLSPLSPTTLEMELQQLVDSGLVLRRGFSHRQRYLFKHALVQDVAYESLLGPQRKDLHGQIARELEECFSDLAAQRPELLAHHHHRAGRPLRAIELLGIAGRNSGDNAGHEEALRHYAKALKIVAELPDLQQKKEQEVAIQALQAISLTAARGYGTPELKTTYQRGISLTKDLGLERQEFALSLGLWNYVLVKGHRQETLELAADLLNKARVLKDQRHLGDAFSTLGISHFFAGNFTWALQHLETSISHFRAAEAGAAKADLNHDFCLLARAYKAWAFCFLGSIEEGRTCSMEAVADSINPFDRAICLSIAGSLRQLLYEVERTYEEATAVSKACVQWEFPLFEAVALTQTGWAMVRLDPDAAEAGLASIHRGLRLFKSTGEVMPYTQHLYYLTDSLRWLGRVEEGLRVAHRALFLAARHTDAFMTGELLRLQGELLCDKGDARRGRDCIRQSLRWSRAQEAQLSLLRGALSLAEMADSEPREQEARQELEAAQARFSAEADCVDLRRARQYLGDQPC